MPYSSLTPNAFWRLCRDDPGFRLSEIWAPKFIIEPGQQIGTAGSCFAQNISGHLRRSSLSLCEVEPAPRGMDEEVARRFGYGLYSARYGNIYTARQLRQLVEDTIAARVHDAALWEREGRWFDALRPGVEPDGLNSPQEVCAHRLDHLSCVAGLIARMDVFVFTLGLTEAWRDRETGLVFPSAPGVIAGDFDPARHEFINMRFAEVEADMRAVLALLHQANPDLRIILTVSPVPLTATATGQHVLAATTYSKSVLRAVAGDLAQSDSRIDYFPSYEIITGAPFAAESYDDNLRTVTPEAVARVMKVFFGAQHAELKRNAPTGKPRVRRQRQNDICEEALLDAFAPK